MSKNAELIANIDTLLLSDALSEEQKQKLLEEIIKVIEADSKE